MSELIKFQCPDCRGPVLDNEKGYLCQKCNVLWQRREGVPTFTGSQPYSAELSGEQMSNLLELAEKKIGERLLRL